MMVRYTQRDQVTLSDTGGDGAIVQVNEVGHGSIDNIVIDDGGSGYEVGDALVFDNSGTGGNSVQAKVSVVNGGFTPEDANSNSDGSFTDEHIVLEDETQKEISTLEINLFKKVVQVQEISQT